MVADVRVVADEPSDADAALLDPVGRHDTGDRRLLVAILTGDRIEFGDDLGVGAEAGEALDERGDALGRG